MRYFFYTMWEINVFFRQDFGVVAIMKFERGVTSGDIFGVIINKHNYW